MECGRTAFSIMLPHISYLSPYLQTMGIEAVQADWLRPILKLQGQKSLHFLYPIMYHLFESGRSNEQNGYKDRDVWNNIFILRERGRYCWGSNCLIKKKLIIRCASLCYNLFIVIYRFLLSICISKRTLIINFIYKELEQNYLSIILKFTLILL